VGRILACRRADESRPMMIDDIYKLCPPLFSMGVIRCYSSVSTRKDNYEDDAAFFKAHSERRLLIRPAQYGEFDLEMPVSDWLQMPTVHVLVTQVSPGVHFAVPVYRGKAFFDADVETDSEISLILAEMARREGIDTAEWMMFELKQKQAPKVLKATNDGIIH
jgi:hypothetical protein